MHLQYGIVLGRIVIQNYITQKTVMSCILFGAWWFRDKVRNVAFKISLIHVDLSTCLLLPSPLIKLMYVGNIKPILSFGYCIKLKVL